MNTQKSIYTSFGTGQTHIPTCMHAIKFKTSSCLICLNQNCFWQQNIWDLHMLFCWHLRATLNACWWQSSNLHWMLPGPWFSAMGRLVSCFLGQQQWLHEICLESPCLQNFKRHENYCMMYMKSMYVNIKDMYKTQWSQLALNYWTSRRQWGPDLSSYWSDNLTA
jgi:hypothetical protein